MKIVLDNLGKRFHYHWIFNNLSFEFESNNSYAITGSNGSGKSTLLKVIAGVDSPNTGTITYLLEKEVLDPSQIHRTLTIAAPYQELIEELTLSELLAFHLKFRELTISKKDFLLETMLESSANKLIKDFSSGMKQRVKLGLALFTKTACTLLDEPTTNMDQQGIDWYLATIKKIIGSRTLIISSNMAYEYDFCDATIAVESYKHVNN